MAREESKEGTQKEKKVKRGKKADAKKTEALVNLALAENTVRRRCGMAKQFFRSAQRKRLIRENPFGELKGLTVKGNRDRDYFITSEEAAVLLDACPNAEW